jgi:hypothetical protein
MAISSRQKALTASTAQACLVAGTGSGFTFKNIHGTLQDPIPVSIKNEDASAVVYWGGSDVDSTHGQSIPAGGVVVMNLYGESEIPYVWSSGTPTVSVTCGRQ